MPISEAPITLMMLSIIVSATPQWKRPNNIPDTMTGSPILYSYSSFNKKKIFITIVWLINDSIAGPITVYNKNEVI